MGKITAKHFFGFIIAGKLISLDDIMFQNTVKSFNIRVLFRSGSVREFLLNL